MNASQRQPAIAEHPPVFCAHCGATQTKSLVLANPPTPTVCIACGGAVVLGAGPLWMERMSELSPDAHALSVIRLALSQSRGPAPRVGRLHA